MAKKAVLLPDGSPQCGGGHVLRCLALGQALSRLGWRTLIAAPEESLTCFPPRVGQGVELRPLPQAAVASPEAFMAACGEAPDVLVLDHYGLERAFEQACRPWARRIAAIDDLANRPHDVDLLVDSAAADPGVYQNLLPESCLRLIGPGFAPLRAQFARTRSAVLPRTVPQEVGRVLISFGASDQGRLARIALDALASAGLAADVDLVLGSAADKERIRHHANGLPFPVELHEAVSDIARLMAAADLAIGAAGVTSWERCSLGLPSVVAVMAENQRDVARRLEASGAASVAGNSDDLSAESLGRALRRLAGSCTERARMSANAARLCDGRGADRIAALLASGAQAKDRRPIWLRPAQADDEALLLSWQRHPETRRNARNPAAPSADEHHRWMERKLAEPNGLFHVIMQGADPAGVLRLDEAARPRAGQSAYEVSILVAPERHGMGLGKGALALASLLVPEAELHAQILAQNRASRALFARAGFVHRNEDWWVKPAIAALAAAS